MGVFIDLKKAFHTVNHQLLCNKIEIYGIRGVALNWITSYLANRSQFVSIDGSHSSLACIMSHVSFGVGPYHRVQCLDQKCSDYVNDLCNVANLAKCILFADDTSLFCSDANVNRLFERVSSVLASMCRWFATNKVSLNVLKTSYILFRNNTAIDTELSINGVCLERVRVATFLSVLLDEQQLNWKPHIASV